MKKEIVGTILESLAYSLARVRDYPHENYQIKQMCMQPILEAIDCMKKLRDKNRRSK